MSSSASNSRRGCSTRKTASGNFCDSRLDSCRIFVIRTHGIHANLNDRLRSVSSKFLPVRGTTTLMKRLLAGGLLASLLFCSVTPLAQASTTGTIRGRVIDATTHAPIVGAKVVAQAPTQSETTSTDASGSFTFISLTPDTYTVSAS